MSLSCIDHLLQEHRLILRAVYVVKAMAEQAEQFKLPEAEDVEELLRFFHHFADEHHQTKEESILFPSLRIATEGKINAPVKQMAFEHEQDRSLIRGLQDAIRTRNHADFAYFGNRLAEVLSNHIYKEDNILFYFAQKAIALDMDRDLVQQMEAFDRTLRPGVQDEWAQTVNRLEWKYLGKSDRAEVLPVQNVKPDCLFE